MYTINYTTAQQLNTLTIEDSVYVAGIAGKDTKIRMVMDSGIVLSDGQTSQVLYEFSSAAVGKFDQSESYSAFAQVLDVSTSEQKLTVIDTAGNIQFEKNFYEVTDIVLIGEQVYVLIPGKLFLFDIHGHELAQYEIGSAVKVCASSENAVIIYADRARNISIVR